MKKYLFIEEPRDIQINSVQQIYWIRILENSAISEKPSET